MLRTPGIDPIEKDLLKQRFANLSTAQNDYMEKQKKAMAGDGQSSASFVGEGVDRRRSSFLQNLHFSPGKFLAAISSSTFVGGFLPGGLFLLTALTYCFFFIFQV